jgi:hypothetical protein
MTPEQTLDWLAQQHFDQCREDRPVQHWIRKMKSELPVQEPVAMISAWSLREVYFDEDGEPSMHRSPPQPPLPVQEPYCYVDPVHLAALNTDQSAEVVLHKNPSGYAARGLYTAPQQRPWVGLTADEKGYCAAPTYLETVARVEAKLKEKNT